MDLPGYTPLQSVTLVRKMWADALGTLTEAQRTWGDLVQFHFGPDQVVHAFHPDAVQQILQANHKNFVKGPLYDDLRPLLGQGLITADGETWKRQRKLVQPAFRQEHLERWGDLIAAEVRAQLDGWGDGGEVEVSKVMMQLTFRVVCRTVFGSDEALDVERMYHVFTDVSEAILAESRRILRLPFWVPTLNHLRYKRALAALEAPVAALLAERRARNEPTVDLFGLLMGARDEDDGDGMSARQLRDEGMTFLFAGHETTGNALTWALHELSLHPEVQDRLHAELLALPEVPGAADLARAPLLRRVSDEVLRLHPPVWWLERQSIGPETVLGRDFPAGTRFALSPHVVQRDPRWWDDPERFDPDRAPPRHKAAYFPFASGPRMCIGSTFALQEMGQALAGIVRRFRVVPAQDVVEADPLVTTRVKGGLRVRLERRVAAAA